VGFRDRRRAARLDAPTRAPTTKALARDGMRATATAPRVATARARRDRATRATGRWTRARTATAPRARLGARSSASAVETLRFLTPEDARDVAETHGTPTYVYDRATLDAQAARARAFPNAYGLTVRYAMKASPNAAILKTFKKAGLHVDASSGYECERAMKAGFEGDEISLSTQELPRFFEDLVRRGVKVNACSLDQLERFGRAFPGGEVGVRFNPGLGSGGTGKTNVGGPSSSFGIWFESLPRVKEIVEQYDLKVVRVHTHIGSGSDPAVWQKVSGMSLDLCREFPSVDTLNLGGGYKVGRMSYEKSTDLAVVGVPVKEAFEAFAKETGRKLKLEIEPGTFLLANSCAVVTSVQDKVVTGTAEGHTFLKLDMGMTEVLRPSLYGSQHPLVSVSKAGELPAAQADYVVVGHCCESGDLLTPAPDEPETISERRMGEVNIGDYVVIEGSGAYCAGMSSKNYNSFPEAPEVMRLADGAGFAVIRRKQTLEQILANEVDFTA
jgi:diaminopimelate decarboxylase